MRCEEAIYFTFGLLSEWDLFIFRKIYNKLELCIINYVLRIIKKFCAWRNFDFDEEYFWLLEVRVSANGFFLPIVRF